MLKNLKAFTQRFISATDREIFRLAAEESAIYSRHELQKLIDTEKQSVSDERQLALFDVLLPTLENVSVTSNITRPTHNLRVRLRYASDLSEKSPIEVALQDIQGECKTCCGRIVLSHCIEKIRNGEVASQSAMRKVMLNKLCIVLAHDLRHAVAFAFLNTVGYRKPPYPTK